LRKIAVIGLIVLGLGALAVVVPASASQTTPNKLGRALRPGATTKGLAPQAAADAFTSNDNFFTQTFNHFGSPSNGSVVAESWIETGFDNTGNPTNIQAFARTILLPKALRTSLQVQLYGLVDLTSNPELINSSATVNSSGKLISQVAAPELSTTAMATDSHCWFFQSANLSVRWSDGRLSTGLFLDESVVVFNFANPACAPA
jgi:hypothetical protein